MAPTFYPSHHPSFVPETTGGPLQPLAPNDEKLTKKPLGVTRADQENVDTTNYTRKVTYNKTYKNTGKRFFNEDL